MYYSSHI